MNKEAASPEQWQTLHRLRAAGCPVDMEHIVPPNYPLRVINRALGLKTNLLPLAEETGVVLSLRIVAAARVAICGFGLRADWLPQPVCWLESCKQHRDYCLRLASNDHLRFGVAQILNWRTFDSGVMKRGSYLQGFLVGTTSGLSTALDEKLGATLWIEDAFGTEYPYTVSVNNCFNPQLLSPQL
jgi:hypothetical protein